MFTVIAGQTFTMFLLIMLGYVILKTGLADHHGSKTLSDILLLAVTPCMILQSFAGIPYDPEHLRSFLLSILLGFLAHFIMMLAARAALRGDADPNTGIERYMSMYSNCGFMGIPIVSAVFGQEGVLYVTGYIVAFNVLTWTHGLTEVTGEHTLKQLKKGLLSPVVFSIAAGLLIFLLQIPIERHVLNAISYAGSMNTPLGMFVAGCVLAETDLLSALKKKRLYLVTALKLFIGPALVFAALLLLRRPLAITDNVFYAILIAAACPAGTTGTMLALRYDRDYIYASQLFVVSTLMSMFTIPLLISGARMLAGML